MTNENNPQPMHIAGIPPHAVSDIIAKRRHKLRVNCILCERRLGWFTIEIVTTLMNKNNGIILCDVCKNELKQ